MMHINANIISSDDAIRCQNECDVKVNAFALLRTTLGGFLHRMHILSHSFLGGRDAKMDSVFSVRR